MFRSMDPGVKSGVGVFFRSRKVRDSSLRTAYFGQAKGTTAAQRRLDPVLKSIANRDLANRALTIGSSVAEYAILGLSYCA
jgi:hypothetical protein